MVTIHHRSKECKASKTNKILKYFVEYLNSENPDFQLHMRTVRGPRSPLRGGAQLDGETAQTPWSDDNRYTVWDSPQNMTYLFSLTEIAYFPLYPIHHLLQHGSLQRYKAM